MTSVVTIQDTVGHGDVSTNRPIRMAVFVPTQTLPSIPVRVDTIRVRGVVASCDMPVYRAVNYVNLATGEIDERITGQFGPLSSRVWLNVRRDRMGTMYGSIELSVPTYRHGCNVEGSTVQETMDTVRGLARLAERYVTWAQPIGSLAVARLDLVRDFPDVPDFDLLLDGLSKVPLPGGISVQVPYQVGGQYTGLIRGTRSRGWTTRLYHKGRQLAASANTEHDPHLKARLHDEAVLASTRCRYEVEARRPVLLSAGIERLAQLPTSTSKMSDLVAHYFERCGYATEVGGISKVQNAMRRMRANPDHHKQVSKMIGYLMVTSLDEPHGIKDPRTVRGLRTLAQSYGLTPADLHDPHRTSLRLDLACGTQVGQT